MRFATKLLLECAGYEVITASDGQEGLDKARIEKPDLILLDLMLPKIDGYKVCRMLKFDRKYNKIPIIIFTVRSLEVDMEMGQDVGADVYFIKPFKPDVLFGKIEELLWDSKKETRVP